MIRLTLLDTKAIHGIRIDFIINDLCHLTEASAYSTTVLALWFFGLFGLASGVVSAVFAMVMWYNE